METDAPSERTFGYRSHVSWSQWVVLACSGGVTLLMMAYALYAWFAAGIVSGAMIGLALCYALATGAFFALSRKLATSQIRLGEDGLAYANFREEGFVGYDELENVRAWYIPYTGGWITLKAPDTTLRMTVVLDDIDAFTKTLHDRLDRLDSPPFDRDNLFGFYQTAAFTDLSWDHFYRSWPLLLGGNLLTWAIGMATFRALGGPPAGVVFTGLITGGLLPWIPLAILDIGALATRLRRNADIDAFELTEITEEQRRTHLQRIGLWVLSLVAAGHTALLLWAM
ncbi:MAG: hypothetical protein ABEL76_01595 [Bradymonadaceae bacterium]